MNQIPATQPCFNCQRSEGDIPVLVWHFRGETITVCCECVPNLIHHWPQVAARLANQWQQEETHESQNVH